MHADTSGAFGADGAHHGGGRMGDELREHLLRRIRRNYLMFGREATLQYLTRLTGVPIGADESAFLAEAERVLGFDADGLTSVMESAGPS